MFGRWEAGGKAEGTPAARAPGVTTMLITEAMGGPGARASSRWRRRSRARPAGGRGRRGGRAGGRGLVAVGQALARGLRGLAEHLVGDLEGAGGGRGLDQEVRAVA